MAETSVAVRHLDEECSNGLIVVLINRLPLELLELVLMRTFIKLFTEHESPFYRKKREAVTAAYNSLSAVCQNWWQTLNGWPQSNTRHWLRHRLQHSVQSVCRPYSVCPRLQFSLTVSRILAGVTECDNKLFVVYDDSDTIEVFGRDNKQPAYLTVTGLKDPMDIVACAETKQLYIAAWPPASACVWRVSLDGQHVDRWLTDKSTSTNDLSPSSLSMTSRRLLVISTDNNSLFMFGSDGIQLKHISLPNITTPIHAVETSHGTFIISHCEPMLGKVSEVDVDGRMIRVYCDRQHLGYPYYLALDSDGRVLVADYDRYCVLLLNSRLELERVLLYPEHHQLALEPWFLCYVEQTGRLIVVSSNESDLSQIQVYGIRESCPISSH